MAPAPASEDEKSWAHMERGRAFSGEGEAWGDYALNGRKRVVCWGREVAQGARKGRTCGEGRAGGEAAVREGQQSSVHRGLVFCSLHPIQQTPRFKPPGASDFEWFCAWLWSDQQMQQMGTEPLGCLDWY